MNKTEKELYYSCLVLNNNPKGFFYKYIEDSNMKAMWKRKNSKLYNLIKKIWLKFNLPFASLFFETWKKSIKKYKYVVIFDNGYHKSLTKYIKKKNKNCIINIYFWNCVTDDTKKFLNDPNVDAFFSFDLEDGKKYNLMYSSPFFSSDMKLKKTDILYDSVFVGLDKGRESFLMNTINEMKKRNINAYFKIVKGKSDFVEYDDYIALINASKSILDITQEGQNGLTARAMESIFLKKKLITNNITIQNYDFYDKKNIFIIGIDDIDTIFDFINTPYHDIPKEIVDYYDYKNWCLRFIKESLKEK